MSQNQTKTPSGGKKSIESVSTESRVFPPSPEFQKHSRLTSLSEYQKLHKESLTDPQGFWSGVADQFYWQKNFSRVVDFSFGKDLFIKWFDGGKTNLCYNALDRHLDKLKDKTAFLFVPNEGPSERISYGHVFEEVCALANGLKKLGLKKGDCVAIYMPMIPQAAYAMLACVRLGLTHNVVFGGFSAASLASRIEDSGASVLITANELVRGNKVTPLKKISDEAIVLCAKEGHAVRQCVVYQHTATECDMTHSRDLFWQDVAMALPRECEPEWVESEHPLFMLYTSGSTGKPKGVLHTTGGYMVYVGTTFKYVFDIQPDDIYFCSADVGWVTGHSYLVYGPLLNGATSVIFEGIPTYPKPDRFWDIIEKEKITVFYTAPTAIRALMREGEVWPDKHNLSSLRLLGTVGEPINPEAWMWYHNIIGKGRCPIVDTYWQTETGGIVISPLPGAMPTKPGSATLPFFGVNPKVIREDGSECDVDEGGYLVIDKPWPGIMRTVYRDHQRFYDTYFARFENLYFTGDSARRDKDGYLWVMGRIDDVVNVSGHRLGTAEIESALVANHKVAEAAVVGFPHDIKGQGLYAYVTLKEGIEASDVIKRELIETVTKEIGPIAKPDVIQFAVALPKTRSGKIMRRILRKIAEGDTENLGDVTTLADPTVVESLKSGRIA